MLGAYALNQLDPAERTAVQAHLDGCAECRAELAVIAPLAGPLRSVDPARLERRPELPPPGLEESILAAIKAEPRPPRRRWILAAAVLFAVGASGVGIGYVAAPDPPKIPIEPVSVTPIAAGIRSTASVVPHTWGMEIKLAGSGYEPGRRYRVVVLDSDGRTAPAGEFIGTGPAPMVCNLNSSVLRAEARSFEVRDESGRVVLEGQV
nr:zf-HC2 domain-containing protein [Kribbella sandramycini]